MTGSKLDSSRDAAEVVRTVSQSVRSPLMQNWLWRELPYVALIVLSLIGIAWTSLTGTASKGCWIVLTPIACLICITAGWHTCPTGVDKTRLITTQAMQWVGVWIAMYLMLLGDTRGMLNNNAIALTLLTLVALGVFVSGIYTRVWQLCVVGAFLAIAVPAVAWVEQGALLLLGIAVVLIGLGFANWWFQNRPQPARL